MKKKVEILHFNDERTSIDKKKIESTFNFKIVMRNNRGIENRKQASNLCFN